MAKDLRTFLDDWQKNHPDDVLVINKEIDTKWETTALEVKLRTMSKRPVIIYESPIGVDGRPSKHKLVSNIFTSRSRCADLLGINPRSVARDFGNIIARRIDPEIVRSNQAPVKEVTKSMDECNLYEFPIPWFHEGEPGPYITYGSVVTTDPETGTHNTALLRCWVKGPRKTGFFSERTGHSWFNILRWWARNEDAPVAIWIGHHPLPVLGSQGFGRLRYPEDHYSAASGVLGEALRLVPTETFRDKVLVPADSEIVVEGVIPKDHFEAEGPFGEYPRHFGPQLPSPVVEVKNITMRKDAYWMSTYEEGFSMAGVFPTEASLYQHLTKVVPEVINVRRADHALNLYVQVRKTRPGIGKQIIAAALSYYTNVLKYVFVFDEDVDIFNDSEILWAMATRSQWDTDLVMIQGHPAPPLDPTIRYPGHTGTVGGIDCTMPAPIEPEGVRPFSPLSKVPDSVFASTKIEDFIDPETIVRLRNE